MNDFLTWAMGHSRPWERSTPLTEDESKELFNLFAQAGLPATAMSAEMADGYIAGCVTSPNPVPIFEWMETVFGQPTLPVCADPTQQERLLQLLVHRFADTHEALRMRGTAVTVDTVYTPLLQEIAPQNCIQPYQLNEHGQRLGQWRLKDWAHGFRTAIQEDEDWDRLTTNPEAYALVGAVLLYAEGYNRDRPDMQVDTHPDLLATMVNCLYQIVDYWRAHPLAASAPTALPFVREGAKVGRNDPCTCGSGKKFKKCCGAH